MLLRHAQLSVQYKGEKMGIREMRKHTAWYTTGMHGSSTLRNKVNQVETFDALQVICRRVDNENFLDYNGALSEAEKKGVDYGGSKKTYPYKSGNAGIRR